MGERGSRRYRRQRTRVLLAVVAGGALAGGAVGAGAFLRDDATTPAVAAAEPLPATSAAPPTTAATLPPTTVPPFSGWVDPASVGQPYSQATVPGLLTFRGNPTRTYYGQGPVPAAPARRVAVPRARHVLAVGGPGRDDGVVRHRLDRPARGVRTRRPHVGRVRRVRPRRALRRRRHRRGPAAAVPDRRHHQGLGDDRSRRVPARLHGLARRLLPGARVRPGRSRPSCGGCRRTTCRPRCGTTTGTAARSCSTTTSSRAARTASSTS